MRKYILFLAFLSISFTSFSQDFSNKGKEFWLCFASHCPNSAGNLPRLSIFITSDQASTGTITMPNGAYSASFNLNTGNNFYQEFIVNPSGAPGNVYITAAESNTVINKSIHIKTDAGQPSVVAYTEEWAGARTAASLLLPVNVLGKKYYAVSSTQANPSTSLTTGGINYVSKSHFQIIATQNNTNVQITPRFNGVLQTPFTVILPNAGDLYQFEPASSSVDITGSYIESLASGSTGCLPIAVFSGTSGIALGAGACTSVGSSDPLFQQLYPISTWGKNFGFIPFVNYVLGNPYRIIASENNTNVYFNGGLVATLNAGDLYPNNYALNPPTLTAPTNITSDKPISVTQFLQSNGCANTNGSQGDPDMVILNPIEQNISDITVFSSSEQGITQRFVNVLIKTSATSSFKINGVSPSTGWNTFTSLPNYSYLKGEPFASLGSYHLTADSGFNAINYGYGANESYAYSAGTNVKDLSQQFTISNQYSNSSATTGATACTGSPFKFKVAFPATIAIDSMDWNCNNVSVMAPNNFPVRVINPTIDSVRTSAAGVVINWYSLPSYYTFNTAGTYTVTITLYKHNADNCGSQQDYSFPLVVSNPQTAAFTYTGGTCIADLVHFTDNSTPTVTTYKWWWDFGDPGSGAANNSILQNPTHLFTTTGPHTVRFANISDGGCLSDTASQILNIPDFPTATIIGATNVCLNDASPTITFTGIQGTAPYIFTYQINGVTQPTITSTGATATVTVPTTVAGPFTYNLINVQNSVASICTQTVTGQQAVVNVLPLHAIALSSGLPTTNQIVCVNTAITPITYTLNGGATGASITGLPTGVTYSVTGNILTISGTPTAGTGGAYNITTTGNACATATLSGIITINANAALALTSANTTTTQSLCINTAIADITYSVSGGAIGATATGLPTGVTGSYAGGVYTITGSPTVTGVFPYTITTTGTCVQATLNGTITVNADATIALTSAAATTSQSLCINTAITNITYAIGGGGTGATLTGSLPAGVTGSFAGGVFTISGTPTAMGTFNYTVTTTGTFCATPSLSGSITVNPDASITLSSVASTTSQTLCVNNSITNISYTIADGGTGATVIGLPTGVTGSYTGGVFTISGTPSAFGTFNYTVTTTGTCVQKTATGVITVNPDATIALTSAASSTSQIVCINNTIANITYAIAGGGTGATLTGTLPAGVTGAFAGGVFTISGTPTANGTFNYTVTTTGTTCLTPALSGSITVNPNATVTLQSGSTSQELCANTVAITPIVYTYGGSATGATVANLPTGITYTVVGNTITISGTPTVATAGAQTYTINTSGLCVQSAATGTITVNALPTADFTISTPDCESKLINFTSTSVANTGVITGWDWVFGDGNTATGIANTSNTYATAGTYTATLSVVTNKGCVSNPIASKSVVVNVNPIAGFINPKVCILDPFATFTDTSHIAAGAITNWAWNFGDPNSTIANPNTSTTQSPTHHYTAVGPYIVTLNVTSAAGCTHSITQNLFVSDGDPVANFITQNVASLCSNDSVRIQNKSTITTGNITTLEICWDVVNNPLVIQTDNTPAFNNIYAHKYPTLQTAQNYTVRLRSYSGGTCFSDKLQTITVNAAPKVAFANIPQTCYDATPFNLTQGSEIGGVAGTGVYTGPGVSGTSLFSPMVAGIGTHSILYTYTSTIAGCVDTIRQNVTVLDTASAQFTFSAPTCYGSNVDFNSSSSTLNALAGTITGYQWNFGDVASGVNNTSTVANPSHNFRAWGTYNVTLAVTTSMGCTSTLRTQQVVISPIPQPIVTLDKPSYCLPNAVVGFINTSTIADGTAAAMTYAWDFGDPASGTLNTSTSISPTHTYVGVGPFTVTLTVTSGTGCTNVYSFNLTTVHPQPTAMFTSNKPTICIGDAYTFTDVTNPLDGTIKANIWNWIFDDGSTNESTNPVAHQYNTIGSKTVKLYITNAYGCNSDTTVQTFKVFAYPTVNAGVDRTVLQDGSVIMQPTTTGTNLQYLWTPNQYLSNNTVKNPTVSNPLSSISYKLTVTGEGGCTASDDVYITLLKDTKIPNTFSPNNDGVNDTWKIDYLNTYPNNRVQVFTRTGQLVFESYGYAKPWDGTYKGKPLPIDTYYYIIEPNNTREPIKGYVTIIK